MTKDRLGISSACFYPEETYDAVERSVSLGFKNVEIFLNSFSELEEPYLDRLGSLCRENDVTVTSVHPFTSGYEYMLFFSAYEKRAADACEFYKKYFFSAAELGAKYVVFHGDSLRAPFIGMDRYCEVLEMLCEAAYREGVAFAHENVSSARSGSPEFIAELRKRIGVGKVNFVLDIKQVLRAGYEPFDMISAMGSDIKHIHINDWSFSNDGSRDGGCRLPGDGELDLRGIIDHLENMGYCGRYIIEVYRKNFDGDEDIIRAKKKLLTADY